MTGGVNVGGVRDGTMTALQDVHFTDGSVSSFSGTRARIATAGRCAAG